jgi:hypothetical protein
LADHVTTESLVHADALNRAARTLWQGIGVDAATAIGAGALLLINDVPVESELFWSSIGVLVLKSVVTSFASYLVRLKVTPKQADI